FSEDGHAPYHASTHFDVMLRLHCRLGHVGNTSMRYDFQIFGEADGRLVATGEITMVMVERNTRKKVRVPDRLREAAENLSGKKYAETSI
ncbi:MAG: acyl-CoA thioesterase, partial [Anaerolineales bacterium]